MSLVLASWQSGMPKTIGLVYIKAPERVTLREQS